MAGNMENRNSVNIKLGTWNIGTLNGKGLEICDELWRRNVDLCCLQEVRWKGCGARLIGLQGRRYNLWWSGDQEGNGGVGELVKEEQHDKINEVRREELDRVISCHSFLRRGESCMGKSCTKWEIDGRKRKFCMKIYQENGPLIT